MRCSCSYLFLCVYSDICEPIFEILFFLLKNHGQLNIIDCKKMNISVATMALGFHFAGMWDE